MFFLLCFIQCANSKSETSDTEEVQKLIIHTIRVNSTKSNSRSRNLSQSPVQRLVKVENVTENSWDLEEVSQIVRELRLKSVCVQSGL